MRLHPDHLGSLSDSVRRFSFDRSQLRSRMVHLGVGAFHRGHQAIYTDDANELAGGEWGVTGISLKSPRAALQLEPQDCLFSVGVHDGTASLDRVLGSLTRIMTATDDQAGASVAAMADPQVEIVTLTITEKGYGVDPASGDLLVSDVDLAHDLGSDGRPRTALGFLFQALRARFEAGHGPLTVMSCDNLPSNGQTLRNALLQFADRKNKEVSQWIDREIRFPSTMVDRIVPAVTAGDLDAAEGRLGLRDEAHVGTEPFSQWVIENSFAGERPAWHLGGAQLVSDVADFERAKLRLLNGPHSAIAYIGYLAGFSYVAEAMAEPTLASFIREVTERDIRPSVREPEGMNLSAYTEELRARFRNSTLRHRTWQIAMDGSQKLPQRLLGTVRDCLAKGMCVDRLSLAVAAWIVYSGGRELGGEAIDVRDPMAAELADLHAASGRDASSLVEGYLSLSGVFGADLRSNRVFVDALTSAVEDLYRIGPIDAARERLG